MTHPILIAALVEDRRHQCPCGTFAQQPYGPYRECLSWTHAGTGKAHLLAWVASLLQIIGKGAES
jgi:hypothetical protein